MIRPFAPLFALALLALPAMAQQEVNITADQFTVDEKTKQAVFTGNVVVVHPSVTVHADKVEAVYGSEGASDIESFVATGAVTLDTPDQKASGERAVFNPGDQLLRLTGDVKVTNASGTVDSEELVVNLATNVSTFTSSGNGRVTGVFTSQ